MAGNVDRVTLSVEAPAIRLFGHGMREKRDCWRSSERTLAQPSVPFLDADRAMLSQFQGETVIGARGTPSTRTKSARSTDDLAIARMLSTGDDRRVPCTRR